MGRREIDTQLGSTSFAILRETPRLQALFEGPASDALIRARQAIGAS